MRSKLSEVKSMNWRSRRFWMIVGYIGSAAWMVFVLLRTGGNVENPMFELIFVVPLAAWIAGLVLARIITALRERSGNSKSS
jgi:hypothetical protein